jgi:hypothetical protein
MKATLSGPFYEPATCYSMKQLSKPCKQEPKLAYEECIKGVREDHRLDKFPRRSLMHGRTSTWDITQEVGKAWVFLRQALRSMVIEKTMGQSHEPGDLRGAIIPDPLATPRCPPLPTPSRNKTSRRAMPSFLLEKRTAAANAETLSEIGARIFAMPTRNIDRVDIDCALRQQLEKPV